VTSRCRKDSFRTQDTNGRDFARILEAWRCGKKSNVGGTGQAGGRAGGRAGRRGEGKGWRRANLGDKLVSSGGRFGHEAEPSKPDELSPEGPVQKPRLSYYRTNTCHDPNQPVTGLWEKCDHLFQG